MLIHPGYHPTPHPQLLCSNWIYQGIYCTNSYLAVSLCLGHWSTITTHFILTICEVVYVFPSHFTVKELRHREINSFLQSHTVTKC